MQLLRAACIVLVCCAVLGACAASAPRGPLTYVVRPNDTLYGIAWRYDLDFRDLARWNDIGRDYRIEIGQVLLLEPPAPAPRAAPPTPPAPPSPALPPATPAAPASRAVPASPAAASATNPAARVAWTWPTDAAAAPRPVPGGGILLLGREGQEVRAAGEGRIVYLGSGLRGYGNLIIIKHGEAMLSAYAHNEQILVREGEEVAAGQTIAHMGLGPHRIAALYFEIRRDGKPVDPLKYLPAARAGPGVRSSAGRPPGAAPP